MRVLLDVVPFEGRALLGQAVARAKSVLPKSRFRLLLTLGGFVLGAVLFALYAWLMLHTRAWPLYVAYAGLGAGVGVILVTLPRVILHFFSKQWHRLLLRQYTDRAQVLASSARRRLTEEKAEVALNDLAVVDFLQRDYDHAVEEFTAASSLGREGAEGNLLAALSEIGQWPRVEELLQGVKPANGGPGAPNLARLAALTTDNATLLRLWEVARERPHPALLNNLGVRSLRVGHHEHARSALGLALQHQAAYAPAQANLGLLTYREGNVAGALSSLASAAALSTDPVIFANFGALLAQAGETRGAVAWLTRAERLQPRDAATHVNLGNAHAIEHKHEEAAEAYESALHLGGQEVAARYDKALLLLAQGDQASALETLREAAKLAPEDPDVLNNLGCLHALAGRYEEAYEHFHRVLADELTAEAPARLTGPRGLYLRNLLRAELGAGHTDEARELLERVGADDGSVAFERGVLHLLAALDLPTETETHRQMRTFNLREAAAGFRQILAAGKGPVAEAAFDLALSHYLQAEYRAAADGFADALKAHPDQVEMNYITGMSYVLAGIREQEQHETSGGELAPLARELFLKGRPFFERAMAISAMHETAAYDLGLLYYMVRDYARALEVLRKVVRNDSPPWMLNALALSQARHAQELQLLAQTASLMPDARKRQIRQEARGLLAGSIHYFRLALQARPDAPLAHANLGLAFMLRNDKGDVEAALQHWQLMHQHGDARMRRTFEEFMQAVSPEAASRLRFQDVELTFRPVRARDWVVLVPPQTAPPRYVLQEVMDVPEWQLQARHPLVRKCLTYRQRAEREKQKLQRLAV